MGRAVLTQPRLLILDEATEGLGVLVIDKNLSEMAGLIDCHHVIEKGAVVWQGSQAALAAEPALLERYLGL